MNANHPGRPRADEAGDTAAPPNPAPDVAIETPWARPVDDLIDALDVSVEQGLSGDEVRRRRQRYGPNRLRTAEARSALSILVEQFKSVIVALLAAATVVSFAFGEIVEGVAIGVVILINAVIGFVTELWAVRSMEALQELSQVNAKVLREGQPQELSAEDVVPGDVLLFDGGDVVTADLRLFEASKLQADESALTGESVPVGKQTDPVDEDAPLAERASMLFKGTAVTRGSGKGVVVATGMETELGNISSLVEEAQEQITPLERRLSRLGHRLIWVTLGVAALVTASGLVRGRSPLLMIRSGLALAVASVPEGLPIVATVALARGMWRMARRNAVVNRLSAVETLGSTNVILTDKTGTLTENRMTVTHLLLPSARDTGTRVDVSGEGLQLEWDFTRDGEPIDPQDDERLGPALQVGVLCNNAALKENGPDQAPSSVGEPTEVALLVAGAKADIHREELTDRMPEEREVAFDPETKMMATFHRRSGRDDHLFVAVKGALEAVIAASTHIRTEDGRQELADQERQAWIERSQELAEQGLRIIAVAARDGRSADEDPYRDLTFLGLHALLDPPREEVRDAIEAARRAGVRLVMVTGDQAATARNVARAVGLVDDDDAPVVHGGDVDQLRELPDAERRRVLEAPILARVSPEQKLDLIALHQEAGAIVAMTGDGVNDAPALKKADIGVAMGRRGTQVAKEAADMILKDDDLSTIVAAIQQGRTIFNNIRKFVLYLLSCNVAEIIVVGLASVADAPLPIRPLQILFLNLVTDVLPALALGVGKGDPHVMERPPRDPDQPVLMRRHWTGIVGYSAIIGTVVLGALAIGVLVFRMEETRAVTVSFLTLAFAQLWHVFNMRDRDAGVLRNDVVQNPWVWGALALCTALLVLAVYVPGLADVLSVEDPGLRGWALVLGMSVIPALAGLVIKAVDGMQIST
ncbi:MAG: cation-transporting P-type ATPase [Chloroflexota bacterium]|nr:cation-transporting P-type ATPase [Chloroflexota bacterium]